jgi:DNA-binding NarL/FixJ family response regulator
VTGGPVRVLIADDQALVRAGFRMILESKPGIEVVGEAADGEAAVEMARSLRPDVALMDIRMPRLDGLAATRQIMGQDSGADDAHPCVIILTTFDLDEYVYGALHSGACGFLLKDVSPEQLLGAVTTVVAGDALLAPSITRRLVERYAASPPKAHAPHPSLSSLTPRETEVLTLLARGMSNGEIASLLVVTEATVKTHVGSILGKHDLHSRAQAVILAYESGLMNVAGRTT